MHLRGLVEISNHCARRCAYCGLRADHADLGRYRMSQEEILACADRAVQLGYGTLVLQAGEDDALTGPWIADLIAGIKNRTSLAVTLSLGERSGDELALWRRAGADRYLLRLETSDADLFARIHPPRPGRTCDRIALLQTLRQIGFEVGSGVMVGIPGQTFDTLADDIALFAELGLDMIGCGPFIAHPDTPLGRGELPQAPPDRQVPNTGEMACRVLALARLACPDTNIPATTALATLDKKTGYELGLQAGANVVMPNLTPDRYRAMYEIYPAKAGAGETEPNAADGIRSRIRAIGRTVGTGRGDSPAYLARADGRAYNDAGASE